jgi:hypothetical protein
MDCESKERVACSEMLEGYCGIALAFHTRGLTLSFVFETKNSQLQKEISEKS